MGIAQGVGERIHETHLILVLYRFSAQVGKIYVLEQ